MIECPLSIIDQSAIETLVSSVVKTNTSGTGAWSDPQRDFCVVGKGIKQQIEDTGDSRGSGGFRLRAGVCAKVILQWNTQKG